MAKVIFIQNLGYPYLGSMSLSAYIKRQGHQCDMLIGDKPEDLLPDLVREKPDLIAFSMMTGMHQFAQQAAPLIKKALPAALIIMGGPHPTYTPEVVESEGIDIICRGEGEEALLALCNALDKNESFDHIPNLWIKKKDGTIIRNGVGPLIENLDALPFADRSLYQRYPKVGSSETQIFMASRGCPYDCAFCFNHQFKELYHGLGKLVRYRSVGNVLDEIRDVSGRIKVRNIYMNDDTFILNKKWVQDFSEAYQKEKIHYPFTCLIRADLADEEIIRKLAEAGCNRVFFGIETGNEQLRNGLLRKKVSDEEIIQTAGYLKKYGIKFRTYNMLGLPGETLEDAFDTVRINQKIRADFPWAALFMPYPGTELGEQSKKLGLLDSAFSSDKVEGTFHSHSPLNIPHRREIENLHRFFQTAVLFPWAFPIIKKLIKLPPNKLFALWFTMIYGLIFIRSEGRKWWETVVFGLKNLKHLSPALSKAKS